MQFYKKKIKLRQSTLQLCYSFALYLFFLLMLYKSRDLAEIHVIIKCEKKSNKITIWMHQSSDRSSRVVVFWCSTNIRQLQQLYWCFPVYSMRPPNDRLIFLNTFILEILCRQAIRSNQATDSQNGSIGTSINTTLITLMRR